MKSGPACGRCDAWDDLPDWITSLAFLKDNQHFVAGTYEQLLLFDARNEAAPKSEPLQPGYVKALRSPLTARRWPAGITRPSACSTRRRWPSNARWESTRAT